MAASNAFNDIVAARTRTAEHILASPQLLSLYEARGGLASDLVTIAMAGRRAEALNQAQMSAQASTAAATQIVTERLTALQTEHGQIMAIAQAVRHDLARMNTDLEILHALDKIMKNDGQLIVRTVTSAKGESVRKAAPARSQEAIRAQIHKDAAALLELTPAHRALAKRKLDVGRLQILLESAVALSEDLAERTARKGAAQSTTREEHEAVVAQKERWRAVYRLLSGLGRSDERMKQLLYEARRRRTAKK